MKKILDEKGKLFGIINVVDLAVILVILCIAVVIAVRLTSARKNANGKNPLSGKEEVYVTLSASLVVPEIAESIEIGEKLVANNHFTTAEVVSVKSEPGNYVANNADGEAVLSKHPLWEDVTIVIKDTVDPSSVILKAGEQEVRVGYSFIFKTQTVETNCRIRDVQFESKGNLNKSAEETTAAQEEQPAAEPESEAAA